MAQLAEFSLPRANQPEDCNVMDGPDEAYELDALYIRLLRDIRKFRSLEGEDNVHVRDCCNLMLRAVETAISANTLGGLR